ncbi:Uncharacterized protein Fot_42318 [Forsythia ovata]|uniref:Uncharacterized protein n=1 Tax=Forsythia ovata TaxID=205694 RepID=A0ABD1RLI4_9LAMI
MPCVTAEKNATTGKSSKSGEDNLDSFDEPTTVAYHSGGDGTLRASLDFGEFTRGSQCFRVILEFWCLTSRNCPPYRRGYGDRNLDRFNAGRRRWHRYYGRSHNL